MFDPLLLGLFRSLSSLARSTRNVTATDKSAVHAFGLALQPVDNNASFREALLKIIRLGFSQLRVEKGPALVGCLHSIGFSGM